MDVPAYPGRDNSVNKVQQNIFYFLGIFKGYSWVLLEALAIFFFFLGGGGGLTGAYSFNFCLHSIIPVARNPEYPPVV